MEMLSQALIAWGDEQTAAANRARVAEVRTLLELPDASSDEEVFVAAHRVYNQSQPHIAAEYGGKAYKDFVDSRGRNLAYYLRFVKKIAA